MAIETETAMTAMTAMKTVGDAKGAIALMYPKLYARFNQAFHAFPDDLDIEDAVQQITADVEGWLTSMPDNFKTSHHALSRPKFGVFFVLKNEEVKARMGVEACEEAIKVIESQWDACKRKLVVAPPAPSVLLAAAAAVSAAEGEGGGGGRGDDAGGAGGAGGAGAERLINTLSQSVRELLLRHYDETVVNLFDGLMACNPHKW